MTKYTTCQHNVHERNHSIVVDPNTFAPFCAVCKLHPDEFPKIDPAVEAYDRAIRGIRT